MPKYEIILRVVVEVPSLSDAEALADDLVADDGVFDEVQSAEWDRIQSVGG